MDKLVRDIFYDECTELTIDSRLIRELNLYRLRFVNKNEDHITFFGGNLTGVQVVRFTPNDANAWFMDILKVDPVPLEERLLALPEINEDFKVSSDTLNLSCVWLAHAIYKSTKLSVAQKKQGMKDALLVLNYKFLTSLMYNYFKYPADKAVAEATYAQLSGKFILKQLKTWGALLDFRVDSLLGDQSIHKDVLTKMDDNTRLVYMLNDSQGRIRGILKNIYTVFIYIHQHGIRITSVSSVIEHDGEEILRDRSKTQHKYMNYLLSIISDRNSFIKPELMTIVERIMPGMSPKLFQITLEWMSNNYRMQGAKVIEEVLTETLIHSYDYLSENKATIRRNTDLPGLLSKIRGVYMSSRSTDPALMALREKTERIVVMATQSHNKSAVPAVRTGVLLYICLRTYTMKHYTSLSATVESRQVQPHVLAT